MTKFKNKGITLIALVITIIVLLILAGISIQAITNAGLFGKANEAKKAQIKAEMKEQLALALQDLQIEKEGAATLDDVTQEWADNSLTKYDPTIKEDASIDGKIVIMTKNDVTGKFIIDGKLNITEVQNDSSIEFSYDTIERIDNKVKILIHVQDKEEGLSKIELPDGNTIIVDANKKEEKEIEYEVEIGTEYKIKIISEDGKTREETILITDYWHNITKNLGEGIEINNTAIKAAYNKPYEAILTTSSENEAITELTVTMGGQAVTTAENNIVDIATGKIYIEKVTGDIEITVTAKVLEIVTTTPYIGTSTTETDSTKSVLDNSQTKGTTLYINFKATLEETNCTVTLKNDTTKTLPYAITTNGKYYFIATGTYNGKTIIEEIEVEVKKYQSAPNLVQYDAGDWTSKEIEELNNKQLYVLNSAKKANQTFRLKEPTNDNALNFTFGGFTYKGDTTNSSYIDNGTIITSRNQSVAPQSKYGTPKYEGWQILEIKDSTGNTITSENEINSKLDNLENEKIYVTKLVHAGCPENFVYYYESYDDPSRAEYLLSGGIRLTNYSTLYGGKTINPRNWDMYKDKELDSKGYIEEVHCMTYSEASAAVKGLTDNSSSIISVGSYCWLAHSRGWNYLMNVQSNGTFTGEGWNRCFGIRPVVSLKSGVFIKSGDGIEGDPYVLGIEQLIK